MKKICKRTRATIRLYGACIVLASLFLVCDSDFAYGAQRVTQGAPVAAVRIVAEYPHDARAFTQGLFFVDGVLHETTGGYGNSHLRRVDIATGQTLAEVSLPAGSFGEGASLVGGRIVWLTWREGVARVYSVGSFAQEGAFSYKGEGWGLAASGGRLVMSDGSDVLTFRDPLTLAALGRIHVRDGDRPVERLNELEWVQGRIWANVWMTERIAEIDPETGSVLRWHDLGALRPPSTRRDRKAVANGIAYDPDSKRLFVTGKRWPILFEIVPGDL